MGKSEKATERNVSVDWSSAAEEPVQPVNVFAVQATRHLHFLNLGFVAPPIIISPADARRAESVKTVSAQVVARVILTPDDMRDLVRVLSDNIKARERLHEQGQ